SVTAASAIAGNFSKNDRIANAIGIPVDPGDLKPTKEIRAQLGLNDYKSAINTFRHYADG
ncbi:MAG TPA: alkylhydroperoxidase-related (seleno)protein, partial [Gammaproteobacteria bacterium]|nr:alkylhydroperoxidase-related (seleno)protein [Gammaproteobacteria bacterium]